MPVAYSELPIYFFILFLSFIYRPLGSDRSIDRGPFSTLYLLLSSSGSRRKRPLSIICFNAMRKWVMSNYLTRYTEAKLQLAKESNVNVSRSMLARIIRYIRIFEFLKRNSLMRKTHQCQGWCKLVSIQAHFIKFSCIFAFLKRNSLLRKIHHGQRCCSVHTGVFYVGR